MAKFKIGDRVIVDGVVTDKKFNRARGTVLTDARNPLVQFDEYIGGHGGDGIGRYGYCWYCSDECISLEKREHQKIVITTDGKETLARLYEGNKVVETATAKCSPDDTYNFETGAKIAFDRLMLKAGEKQDSTVDGKKWRVVNRAAKVGDYIRLKYGFYSFNKKGDILRAENVSKSGLVRVRGCNHPRNTGASAFAWCYNTNEYEVVEPIEAEPKYKVGERYCRAKGHGANSGVIEITEVTDEWISFKIVEGMEDWLAHKRFMVGSAFESLLTPYTTPKYYNGKVVCIRSGYDWWTVGKVYKIKDGYIRSNDGIEYGPYISAEDARHAGHVNGKEHNPNNEFIPFVE